jgi:flagellar biosynthesis/type III secretory pathway protein FliH
MRAFNLTFPRSPRLRNVVRASAPSVQPSPPRAPTQSAPPTPTAADNARQERQFIEQTLAQVQLSIELLAVRYDTMVAEMRQAAVELAIAVAGRVVFDKLQAGEFPIEEMVRQAVARLPEAPEVRIYLHPEDLILLRRRLIAEADPHSVAEQLLPYGRGAKGIHVEADASLRRGSCRAEAGEIHVLADLAGQLAELRQQLLWSASHARSGPGPAAP